jgi:hypothetical protein
MKGSFALEARRLRRLPDYSKKIHNDFLNEFYNEIEPAVHEFADMARFYSGLISDNQIFQVQTSNLFGVRLVSNGRPGDARSASTETHVTAKKRYAAVHCRCKSWYE